MHPCMPLLASLSECYLLVGTLCRHCVGIRGPLSACGIRCFQRDKMRCDGSAAAQAGWPPDARVRQHCCERLHPFGKTHVAQNRRGCWGLVFLFIFVFNILFLNFAFSARDLGRTLAGQDPAPTDPAYAPSALTTSGAHRCPQDATAGQLDQQ